MHNPKELDELSLFVSTDFEPYKFINSVFQNCSFSNNKTGCPITFDDDYSAYWIYFVNFLGTLAVLPGNIVSALLMDRIGRLTMLGMCLVSCKIPEPPLPLPSRGSLSPTVLPTPTPVPKDLHPAETRRNPLRPFIRTEFS